MTPFAHLAGGYIGGRLVNQYCYIWLIGSIFPDIDAFFSTYLSDHHSFLHTPLFWITVLLISYSLTRKKYILYFIGGVFIHLFLDWFGGRSAGIQLFYPFDLRDFSLYPLQPERGKIPISIFPGVEYLKFYQENLFLFVSEIVVTILAFVLVLVNRVKTFKF